MRMSRPAQHLFTLFVVVVYSSWLFGQNPQLHTKTGRRFPTVVFTSVLWSADPSYYSIAIDSSGTATYQSIPASQSAIGVPYTVEFQVSDRTRRIAFNLAQRLNYFIGLSDESGANPNKASVHTLAFIDEHWNNQFSYSNSTDPDVEEITSVFEELSETFESGRKLAYLQRHDKSTIQTELQNLQNQTERRRIREFQSLAPILRSLTSDPTIEAGARSQAAALLKIAEGAH